MKQRLKGLFAIVMALAVLMSFTVVAYARDAEGNPESGYLYGRWYDGEVIYPGDILCGAFSGGGIVQVDANDKIIPGGNSPVYDEDFNLQDFKCYGEQDEFVVPDNDEGYDGYILEVGLYLDQNNKSYYVPNTQYLSQFYLNPIEITYTINYDVNAEDCIGSVEPLEASYFTDKTLSDGAGLSRAGYRLMGWSMLPNEDGFVKTLELGGSAAGLSKVNGANITLYAIWEEEKYCCLDYDANGGNGNIEEQRILLGEEVKLSNGMEFDRDGYTLVGWNTQAGGKGESYRLGGIMDIQSDVTLYAIWEKDDKQDNLLDDDITSNKPVDPDNDNPAISPEVPQTGGETNVMMIVILFICSFTVICLVIYKFNVAGKYSR